MLNLHDNLFEQSLDLFSGLNSLQEVYLDNNPFSHWSIPETVKEATSLKILSLVNCNIVGMIPNIFSSETLPSLVSLKTISENYKEGCLRAWNARRYNNSISVLHIRIRESCYSYNKFSTL
ncbi:Leucine-rich repeat protein kinase family protein [Raphanus sativus]|nr:Leucine-rich repeat protein kinase family protein [Raphanus sativus]